MVEENGENSPGGELRELAERRAAEVVQSRVEKALISRYAWIGLLVAALTGGTVTLLVNSALVDTRADLAVAEALRDRSLSILDRLEHSLESIHHLEESIGELTAEAQNLRSTATLLRQDQTSSEEEVLGVSEKIQERLDVLESVVQELNLSAGSRRKLADVTRKVVRPARKRVEKRRYRVHVINMPTAKNLKEALTRAGFSAAIYGAAARQKRPADQQTVVVGREVPFG